MSDNRDIYVKKMKAKLDQWNAEIAKLEAIARQRDANARLKFESQMTRLKEKRQAANEQLDELRHAGETAWKDLRAGVEGAVDVFGEALKSARSRFSSRQS